MKLFFDTKKKTMPQQVKRNEEDIETLKNEGFIVKPRGKYDATKTYHKFDLVSYDGDSYIFVSETDAVGIPVTNEDYWQLYTSGGLSVEIGTTETLPAGSNAVVTNTGSSTDAVLNFGIPTGAQGPQGEKGDKGDKGDTGATGAQGPTGPQGPAGANGAGVASGGTTGQVLKKKSNTDYDTEWANDTAGMENPMTSIGDMIYGGPTGTPTALAKGTSGQVLTMKQDETGPEWANASGAPLYKHTIKIEASNLSTLPAFEIITNDSTTFTATSFAQYLYDNGYSQSKPLSYTNGRVAFGKIGIIVGVYPPSNNTLYMQTLLFSVNSTLNDNTITNTYSITQDFLSVSTIVDNVTQII